MPRGRPIEPVVLTDDRQAMLDGADIGEALRAVVDSVIAETEDEGAPPMAPVEAPDTGTRGFVSR